MVHDFVRFPELTNSQMDVYYWNSPHKQIVDSFHCRVVKVTDGDTIRVETNFRDFDFPIRLLDINAPEMNEGGQEAKDWLTDQVLNAEIEVIVDPFQRVGKWGRLLGKIFHRGMDMGETMMILGLATKFDERNEGKIGEIKWQEFQ